MTMLTQRARGRSLAHGLRRRVARLVRFARAARGRVRIEDAAAAPPYCADWRPAAAAEDAPLDPAFRRYVDALPSLLGEGNPNVFWTKQLARAHEALAHSSPGADDLARLRTFLSKVGYGFEDLPAGVRSAGEDPDLERAVAVMLRADVAARALRTSFLRADKTHWEHSMALRFLSRSGVLDEYLAFLRPLGVRSNMSIARHWWYARLLRDLSRRHLREGPLDVLEVGAGAGNLACFLALMIPIGSYTIVDLPEMLIASGYSVQRHLPAAGVGFGAPPAEGSPLFHFTTPARLDALPGASADLCLNFNSLMEMDRATRDGYIDAMYRIARRGAMHVNVNRRQRALPQQDGTTFDNNPLRYPYRADDRILAWEEDPFQQITRTGFAMAPSLAVLRAALVNEPDAA